MGGGGEREEKMRAEERAEDRAEGKANGQAKGTKGDRDFGGRPEWSTGKRRQTTSIPRAA